MFYKAFLFLKLNFYIVLFCFSSIASWNSDTIEEFLREKLH